MSTKPQYTVALPDLSTCTLEFASKLGIDPAEFRLRNYTIYGDQSEMIKYSAKNLDKCIRKVVDST
ncbi:MAG: molybdopterin-dependent oxidoreductase, partial [Nitrososphaerota archaeon]|nr:molybdopterin-dependent oxidoreductase [Nitrososphaerota archaeon]